MLPVVSSQEMQSLDLQTMQKTGTSSYDLMERVSEEMLKALLGDTRLETGNILVLCGPGNNGGDAYRLAEKLAAKGRNVWVCAVMQPQTPDCIKAANHCRRPQKLALESIALSEFKIVIDGIFGNAGKAVLDRELQKLFRKLNRSNLFRISLDIPSGINAKTAEVHPDAFQASLSYVVAFPRESFLEERVAECLNEIRFIASNFFVRPAQANVFALEGSDFIFQKQKKTGHKGLYGRCGIVGGSASMPGAAILAAEAAHRAGAGYVSLYFASGKSLTIKVADASFLFKVDWKWAKVLNQETAWVLGCGGMPKEKFPFENWTAPTVIDADALDIFSKKKKSARPKLNQKSRFILTPHIGEAARILHSEKEDLTKDRRAALQALVAETRQSLYLKGAPGLLSFEDSKTTYVNLSINPVFSKAGSGDILAGILGGFLAQAPDQFEDAIFSGLIFQKSVGEVLREQRATISSDQLKVFSEAFRHLRNERKF